MFNIINFIKDHIKTILAGMIIISIISIIFMCCNTFSPVKWDDRLPAECNIMMNVLKSEFVSKDKSGQVPVIEKCMKCLNKIRCQIDIYGKDEKGNPNPINYSDAIKYNNYNNCKNELN